MMNRISEKQNEDKQLQRLAAQRELYSSAKKLQGWQWLASVFVPIGFTVASVYAPGISFVSSLYGICLYLFDSLIFEPAISKRRAKATKIQELFDCDVLELPQSPFRVVKDVTVDDVLFYFDAHKKIPTNIEKIRNWYPKEVGQLDISIARLICQRINYCWDSRLRSSYSTTIKTVNVIIVIIVMVAFVVGRIGGDHLLLALSGLLPLFRFSIKQFQDNKDSSEKLSRLNKYFDEIWERILNNRIEKKELDDIARQIQDEVYENRTRNPLIPDFFYRFSRDRDESLMSRTAESLVEEVSRELS